MAKEQGCLRMEKINKDYKRRKFRLNSSRCANSDLAILRFLLFTRDVCAVEELTFLVNLVLG